MSDDTTSDAIFTERTSKTIEMNVDNHREQWEMWERGDLSTFVNFADE